MPTCTRILEFDAGHRLMKHESKCFNIHGHRYKVEITARATELDRVGRVVDFGIIKAKVGTWIDQNIDHTIILNQDDIEAIKACSLINRKSVYIIPAEPTAENLALHFLDVSNSMLRGHNPDLRVVHVRVWETPNCYADAFDHQQTGA